MLMACTGLGFACAQPCIDTVENGLTLLNKIPTDGNDCLFTVKFCLRKTSASADHIDYAVYHTNGIIQETVDVSGVQVGSVYCKTFTFIANCNSTASFIAVGRQVNNSICGVISDLIILPIRLLSFSGELQKSGRIFLKWQTASESHSSHFIVQKSKDGMSFLDIAKIKAAGESNSLQSYSFEIKANAGPASVPANYYRLKMLDLDEKFNYSQIIHLNITGTHKIEVHPNPASVLLNIDKGDFQKENLKMINLQGQEISLVWSGENTLDLRDMSSGIYFVKYLDEVIRIIKD